MILFLLSRSLIYEFLLPCEFPILDQSLINLFNRYLFFISRNFNKSMRNSFRKASKIFYECIDILKLLKFIRFSYCYKQIHMLSLGRWKFLRYLLGTFIYSVCVCVLEQIQNERTSPVIEALWSSWIFI